jgi:acrylyl-CoA reductase (NADPH)
MDLPGSVAPFILRGVTLAGIDSVMAPMAKRERAWALLAENLSPDLLDSMTQVVGLSGALEVAPQILAGQIKGRVVVDVNRA